MTIAERIVETPVQSRPGNRKRSVLQILHSSDPGGVKTLADEIADGLTRAGCDVETVTLYPESAPNRFARLGSALRMAWRLLTMSGDVLITYQATASLLAGTFGRLRFRTRIIHQTALPEEVPAPLRIADRLIGTFGGYTANVVNTRLTASRFTDYPASYRATLVLIEHGVAPIRPRRRRIATLCELGIPDTGAILFNAGRLAEQKNQAVLLPALKAHPTARLVIAGAGPDRDALRAQAAVLGVTDRLHLLGDLPHETVVDLFGASDVFVFPSRWESFGIAAVEAASAGLPVIASDLPVLREVLATDKGTRTVFVPHDMPEAWTAAIGDAIAAPVGDCAWATAITAKYSPERMLSAYRALIASDGKRRSVPQ